jgi:hypothetical protein
MELTQHSTDVWDREIHWREQGKVTLLEAAVSYAGLTTG